jgi:alkaline phosphatase
MIGDGWDLCNGKPPGSATVNLRHGLVMDSLPISGMVSTGCADPLAEVTDSAAAATALATGVKTLNGVIGTRSDGRVVPSILELAKRAGKAVGLVTTSPGDRCDARRVRRARARSERSQ